MLVARAPSATPNELHDLLSAPLLPVLPSRAPMTNPCESLEGERRRMSQSPPSSFPYCRHHYPTYDQTAKHITYRRLSAILVDVLSLRADHSPSPYRHGLGAPNGLASGLNLVGSLHSLAQIVSSTLDAQNGCIHVAYQPSLHRLVAFRFPVSEVFLSLYRPAEPRAPSAASLGRRRPSITASPQKAPVVVHA